MKCSYCDIALSPTQAYCPRCGATNKQVPQSSSDLQAISTNNAANAFNRTANSDKLTTPWQQQSYPYPTPSPAAAQAELSTANEYDIPQLAFPTYDYTKNPGTLSDIQRTEIDDQLPVPLPPALSVSEARLPQKDTSGPQMVLPSANTPAHSAPSVSTHTPQQHVSSAPGPIQPLVLKAPPETTEHKKRSQPQSQGITRAVRVGFATSSVCIITGTLLLIFVFLMAQNLPQTSATANTRSVNTQTPPTITATVPTPTPAEAYQGSQYIESARMASLINEASGQVQQYSTTFKQQQKIYVSFAIHTSTQIGAVCLQWFMNNQYVTHYEFAVASNTDYTAFSYAWMPTTGPGYVELSWASSMACADKKLAQHVTFTVTE